MTRLSDMEARRAAVTPGRWQVDEDPDTWVLYAKDGPQSAPRQIAKCPKRYTAFAEYWPDARDSAFIVNAPEDLDALLRVVRLAAKVFNLDRRPHAVFGPANADLNELRNVLAYLTAGES